MAVGFYYGFGLIHSMPYLYDGVALTEYDRDNEETDESMGLTLGYAVFTTPYLELQPFIGFGGNYFNNGLDDMDFSMFVTGGNVDIRLGANHVKSTDVAFELGFMLRPIFKKNGNHPFSSLSLKWVGDGQPEGFVALDAD